MSWVRSDAGAPQTLIRSKNLQFPWSFTPGGKRLAFLQSGAGGYDLWTVPLEGDPASGIRAGKPEAFLSTEFDERSPSFTDMYRIAADNAAIARVQQMPATAKGNDWCQAANPGFPQSDSSASGPVKAG